MPKLLLVEDHEEIWDFLSRRSRRRGFEVLVATDGREGVERARSERPDLVTPIEIWLRPRAETRAGAGPPPAAWPPRTCRCLGG